MERMGTQERDYILRMIAAAAAIARRLRERLAAGESADEIARDARAAQGELLGRDAMLIAQLDAASAAGLLRDVRRIAQWVELLRVEAAAQHAAGRDGAASTLEQRADALEQAAARLPNASVSR